MVLPIATGSKAKVWSEFLGRNAIVPAEVGFLHHPPYQRRFREGARGNRAAVNGRCLFLSPLVTGSMHGLYLVKNGVDLSEFVTNTPYVSVDRISLYQTLTCHLIQRFVVFHVSRVTSQSLDDPELGQREIYRISIPTHRHAALIQL